MSPRTPPTRVLIVDDVPENVALLAQALERQHDIRFALSGEEALALVEAEPPDLVILDVMMPGIDGFEVLRRVRAAPWGETLPVILLTADDRIETQVAGLNLGADDFITKPVVLPVVQARVRNALERQRLLKEQKALNRELQRVTELNSVLLASAGVGIYSTDREGICTSINPAALSMLGFAEADVIGRHQHHVFHHSHPDGTPYPAADCPIFATLQDGETRVMEDALVRVDGSFLPVQITVTALRSEGVVIGSEVIFNDISESQRMQRELLRLATTDELTGVCNRRRFLELGEAERTRVARYGRPSALLMLDLDHFKRVNDEHGHAAGDAVLKGFAGTVSGLLREADVFGRIGGEEFAVLLPETELAGALAFAERLRAAVASLCVPFESRTLRLTTSVGATEVLDKDTTFDEAMVRADRGLYAAKDGGRNRVAAGTPP